MAFYDKFPYTNFQELNLDQLIAFVKQMREEVEEIGENSLLKYADPIEWNITSQYETNTVVLDQSSGTAYMSMLPVPAGIAITNTDYWQPIFDMSNILDDVNKMRIAFTTPEEFGAAGDGVTNDTLAFQDAVNSGKPVLASKNYRLTSSITLTGNRTVIVPGEITSAHSGPAFRISDTLNMLYVSRLTGNAQGTGIDMYVTGVNRITAHNIVIAGSIYGFENGITCSTVDTDGVQYNKIMVSLIRNCTYGLRFNMGSATWVNSNIFEIQRIQKAQYGIYANPLSGEIDGNIFKDIGLEVITGRSISLARATSNKFSWLRMAERFTGDYLFHLEECYKNIFEGDINLAMDQFYSVVDNANAKEGDMLKNIFHCKLIARTTNGTWFGNTMYEACGRCVVTSSYWRTEGSFINAGTESPNDLSARIFYIKPYITYQGTDLILPNSFRSLIGEFYLLVYANTKVSLEDGTVLFSEIPNYERGKTYLIRHLHDTTWAAYKL